MKKVFIAIILVLSLSTGSQAFVPVVVGAWTLATWLQISVTSHIAAAGAYLFYNYATGGSTADTTGTISRNAEITWVDITSGLPVVKTAPIKAKVSAADVKSIVSASPLTYPQLNSAINKIGTPVDVSSSANIGDNVISGGLQYTVTNKTESSTSNSNAGIIWTFEQTGSFYQIMGNIDSAGVGLCTSTKIYLGNPRSLSDVSTVPATTAEYTQKLVGDGITAPANVSNVYSGDIDKLIHDNPNVVHFEDSGITLIPPVPATDAEMAPFVAASSAQNSATSATTAATASIAAQAAAGSAAAASTAANLAKVAAETASTQAQTYSTVAAQNSTAASAAAAAALTAYNQAVAAANAAATSSDASLISSTASAASAALAASISAQDRADIAKGYADSTAVNASIRNAASASAASDAATAAATQALADTAAAEAAKDDNLTSPAVGGNNAYDTVIDAPVKKNITGLLGGFINSSPIVSMVKSFKMTTSSPLADIPIGMIYGQQLSFNFSRWESVLTGLGGVLILIMHGYCVLIVVRGW